jgi:hypothetical protein
VTCSIDPAARRTFVAHSRKSAHRSIGTNVALSLDMYRTPLVSLISTIAFTTLVAAAGCASDYKEEESQRSQELVTNNARTAYQFFVGRGLTPIQSAAIVGNLQQESTPNISPGIAQPGGRGRGIAQWSTGGRWDTESRDNVRWYAAQHRLSMTSLNAQLAFIWYELETFPSYRLAQLRAAQTIEAAVSAFSHGFERCGTCNDARRVQYARAVLTALQNGAPAASSSSSSESDAGPPPPTGKGSGEDPPAGDEPGDKYPEDDSSSDDDGSDPPPDKGGGK